MTADAILSCLPPANLSEVDRADLRVVTEGLLVLSRMRANGYQLTPKDCDLLDAFLATETGSQLAIATKMKLAARVLEARDLNRIVSRVIRG